MRKKEQMLFPIDLTLFDSAPNTNVTTDNGLTPEMREYYSDYLIDMAEAKLVHDQFGQKQDIPQGNGLTVKFRKYSPLAKLTTALTEGVTPDGQKITVSQISSDVAQYGGYVMLSDILLLTAIDNNLLQATRLIGSQAGRTLDTITREVLVAGTNVQYGADSKTARYLLTGGQQSGNDYLTVDCIKRAVRKLKVMNAEPIGDSFVAIVHPSVDYDLTNDAEWKYPHQYVDTEELYAGEIGRIGGCRFVETTEAKIFHAADLTADDAENSVAGHRQLTTSGTAATSSGSGSSTLAVAEAINATQAAALAGRKVIIGDYLYTVAAATAGAAGAAKLKLQQPHPAVASGKAVYPGEAGAAGRDVYATLVIADNAYGVTNIAGGGLQHIVKQLGSAGTSDPLNQRATCGWKATKTAEILVDEYMVRIETCSTYEDGAN